MGWGASGAVVRTPRRPGPRERRISCLLLGVGVGAESAQLGWYQGWGRGRCSPEPPVQPAPLDPGPRAPPEPTVLILPAPGKACFLLLMGCGHQRRGAQATSEVWGLSTGRTAVPPQGTEPTGRPGCKVRRSQAGRAAASHAGSPSPCEPVWSLPDPAVPSESPLPHPGNHTLGQVGGRPPRASPSQRWFSPLLGPPLLFHKLKKFLQAQLTPPQEASLSSFFLSTTEREEHGFSVKNQRVGPLGECLDLKSPALNSQETGQKMRGNRPQTLDSGQLGTKGPNRGDR